MNTQPTHDIVTGDLRGAQELMAKPDDIAIADLPNADSGDMRGHEPAPESDVESDHTKMIVAGVVAAIVVGVIVSYATGMWNPAPPAPAARVAAIVVPAPLPVIAPQPAAVQATPPVEVESAPVPAPVAKHAAAPNRKSVVRAEPKPIVAPPEIIAPTPPAIAPVTTMPDGATGGLPPIPPVQVQPDQPAPPPQVLPDQPTPSTP